MDEDTTAVLDKTGDAEAAPVAATAGGAGGDSGKATGVGAAKPGIPRWWLALALVATLLFAVGIGVTLGMKNREPAPEPAAPAAATVPDVRGMTLERATADLASASLTLGEVQFVIAEASVAPAGTVMSQEPLPGVETTPGAPVALLVAQAPEPPVQDQEPSGDTASAGSDDQAAGDPPPAPEDVSADDIKILPLRPAVIDPSLILAPQWTTVVQHSGTDLEWLSGPVQLGSGDKRIILNADGPNGYLIAVHSWGTGDTDWKLQSILVSQPGELPYQSVLNVVPGTYTFRMKSQDTSVYWTLQVQEKR